MYSFFRFLFESDPYIFPKNSIQIDGISVVLLNECLLKVYWKI
nr:MAG TPA: lumazine protein [Caudoviricetes sp.]